MRDGVPTGITREMTGASPAGAFAGLAAGSSARSAVGAANPPATVAPSSSTASFGTTEIVVLKLGPDDPSRARAGDGVALTGAFGLVVEGSAIMGASRVERTYRQRTPERFGRANSLQRRMVDDVRVAGVQRESRIPFRFNGPKDALRQGQIARRSAKEHAFDAHECTRRQSELAQRRVRMTAFSCDHEAREFLGPNRAALLFEALDVGIVELLKQFGFSSVGLGRNCAVPPRLHHGKTLGVEFFGIQNFRAIVFPSRNRRRDPCATFD